MNMTLKSGFKTTEYELNRIDKISETSQKV